VHERSDLTVDEVPSWYVDVLADGIAAADLGDAQRIVENAPRRSTPADADTGGAGTDDAGTDGADTADAPDDDASDGP
jgi:hypothetical protein